MGTDTDTRHLPYAPTDTADIIYPESDGKPIAETEFTFTTDGVSTC